MLLADWLTATAVVGDDDFAFCCGRILFIYYEMPERETIHKSSRHTQTNCIKVECIINNDPQSVLSVGVCYILPLIRFSNDIIIFAPFSFSSKLFSNLLFLGWDVYVRSVCLWWEKEQTEWKKMFRPIFWLILQSFCARKKFLFLCCWCYLATPKDFILINSKNGTFQCIRNMMVRQKKGIQFTVLIELRQKITFQFHQQIFQLISARANIYILKLNHISMIFVWTNIVLK